MARQFAPHGDLCNCESELHGHGYPCGGVAQASYNKVFGVGEVCWSCYQDMSPGDRVGPPRKPVLVSKGRRRKQRRRQ